MTPQADKLLKAGFGQPLGVPTYPSGFSVSSYKLTPDQYEAVARLVERAMTYASLDDVTAPFQPPAVAGKVVGPVEERECESCRGRGRVEATAFGNAGTCYLCSGTGRIPSTTGGDGKAAGA